MILTSQLNIKITFYIDIKKIRKIDVKMMTYNFIKKYYIRM